VRFAPQGLLTNFCVYDCVFCVNRLSSNTPRARFKVEEVVALTLGFYRRNMIERLFLSSGIAKSEDHTMEEMVRAPFFVDRFAAMRASRS
jgi:predicted DNA-binding helix-hairpin-helix protein